MLVTWETRHELGLPEIDAEHRVVVDIINRLNAMSGKPSGELKTAAGDLERYVRTHFQREERLMEAANYPELAAHKAEHAAFATRVADFSGKAETEMTAADLSSVLMALVSWWMSHIGRTDPKYIPAIKGLRR